MTLSTPAHTTVPAAGTYTFDPSRSTIRFTTRHLFGLSAVRGTFGLTGGEMVVGSPLSASRVTATADVTSFSTGNPKRDTHVLSADFLSADDHPEIAFSSERVEQDRAGLLVHGTLTVRGVPAPLTLRVTGATAGDDGAEITATGTVDRYEHGIKKMPGMAGRRLTLHVSARAQRS